MSQMTLRLKMQSGLSLSERAELMYLYAMRETELPVRLRPSQWTLAGEQFETNFSGTLRVVKAVLPLMEARAEAK